MSTDAEFSIPIVDLDAAGKDFRFPIRSVWLRGSLEGTDVAPSGPDGELQVRLSKSGRDVVVRGNLRADVVVPCGRCLEPARIAVRESFSALAVPATVVRESAGAKDDDDLPADQADVVPFDGETLVLDDLVRDELVLGIPMIPLCSDACPGIRPEPQKEPAAEESTLDPRLRPLLSLKKNPH